MIIQKVSQHFTNLDDYDIYGCSIKNGNIIPIRYYPSLSNKIVKRELFKVKLEDKPLAISKHFKKSKKILNTEKYAMGKDEINYFLYFR